MNKETDFPVASADLLKSRQEVGFFAVAFSGLLGVLLMLNSWSSQAHDEEVVTTAVPLLIALGLFVVMSARSLRKDHTAWRWAMLLFAMEMILTQAVNQLWWQPQIETGGNDWDRYEQLGWMLAQDGFRVPEMLLPFAEYGMTFYVGVVYAVFGHNPAVLAVTHTLFFALTGLQVYQMVICYGEKGLARRALVLWMLLPIGIVHCAFPSKEILVTFLFVAAHNQLERYLRASGWRNLAIIMICFIFLGFIRSTMSIVFAIFVAIRLLFCRKGQRNLYKMTFLLLAVLIMTYTIFYFRASVLEKETQIKPFVIARFNEWPDDASYFTSTRESSLALATYWDADFWRVYLIPLRIPFVLFTPFPPIYFKNLIELGNALNVWLLLFLSPGMIGAFWIRGIQVRQQFRNLLPLWLPVTVIATALSAGFPFIHARYPMPAFPYMIGIAAIGLKEGKHTRFFYQLLPPTMLCAVVLYFVLKIII